MAIEQNRQVLDSRLMQFVTAKARGRMQGEGGLQSVEDAATGTTQTESCANKNQGRWFVAYTRKREEE